MTRKGTTKATFFLIGLFSIATMLFSLMGCENSPDLITPAEEVTTGTIGEVKKPGAGEFAVSEKQNSKAAEAGSAVLPTPQNPGISAAPANHVNQGELLRIGQQRGDLSRNDATLIRGNRRNIYYDLYHFDAAEGDTVTIEMKSIVQFGLVGGVDNLRDTYLYLYYGRPFGELITINDDHGGTLNSKMVKTLQKPGTYYVVATSYGSFDFGPYSISLSITGIDLACHKSKKRRLSTSDRQFRGGEYYDIVSFDGVANQWVTIDLTSGDFDTWMTLRINGGRDLDTDDDDGDGTNSRISWRLPLTGKYEIVVTSYFARETGEYTVSLDCR